LNSRTVLCARSNSTSTTWKKSSPRMTATTVADLAFAGGHHLPALHRGVSDLELVDERRVDVGLPANAKHSRPGPAESAPAGPPRNA
jgi:hypothetical protein